MFLYHNSIKFNTILRWIWCFCDIKAFGCHLDYADFNTLFFYATPKKFPCYKKYENSKNILDEKAKCQPWIIKFWMKKPILDEGSNNIGWNIILHPKYGWM
jgi:hypothetical protein